MIGLLISLALDTAIVLQSAQVTATQNKSLTANQELRGQELQSLSTSSVADALKFFAGVQLKDYGGLGGQKTINVRSMGTQHTGVFIDGIRITNAQNGMVDLGKYSLSNMEAVELYNANKVQPLMSASEYASASTVYFTTKRPTENAFTLNYKTGSFSTNAMQLNYSLKNRFFADYTILGTKGNYPFKYKSQYEDTTGHRHNDDIFYTRFETGYFTDHFRSHGYFYYANRGVPGGVVRRLSDRYQDVGRETDLNYFLQASYQNEFHNLQYKWNGRYAYDHLRYNSDYENNMFIHARNHYVQQDYYNSLALSYTLWKFQFSTSPDLRWSDLTCDVVGMAYVYRIDYKQSFQAQFRHRGLTLSGSWLFTDVKDHSNGFRTADRLKRWTYAYHLGYKVLDGLTLRTFYKSVFRAPTLNDLYYTQVGRRNLKPEYTKQFDIGAKYSLPWLNVQLDWYHNEVSDKIICVPQGGSYNWRMINRGYVETNGLDLSARAKWRWGSFFLTGTYQNVKDLTDKESGDYGHQLLYSPTFSASAILTIEPVRGWSLSVSNMYCGRRWWTYADPDDYLRAYDCTDLKLQYTWRNLNVALDVDDVFDQHYELIQRWPLPARRWQLSFVYKIPY